MPGEADAAFYSASVACYLSCPRRSVASVTNRSAHPAFLPTVVAVILAPALASCTSTSPADSPTTAASSAPAGSASPGSTASAISPAGQPTAITSGLTSPWSVVFYQGTALVSERDTGRILELDDAGNAREVIALDDVVSAGEGGLLGLAVDEEDRLFAYSTGPDGNRIQRFDVAGSPGELRLENQVTIIDSLPSATYHNGGRIAFGPDGLLYAGVGDAGDRTSAQDLEALSGKILRMTADGEVPSDNPFPDSLVYSYGHRNVQGLGWAQDGTMFASEFGQDTWDELNIITSGGNYGWPVAEGIDGGDDFIDPVQQWEPSEASPSGLTVHGDTIYIANLRGERLRAIPVADPTAATDLFVGEFGRIRAVAPAPDGSLWFVTGNMNSRVSPRLDDDHIMRLDLP